MTRPLAVAILGRRGLGRSEAVDRLVALFHEKGCRVGVIKRMAKPDLEIDEPGKDTYRYRMDGAEKVILSGPRRLALFANLEEETPWETLLEGFSGFDVVFLEGYELRGVKTYRLEEKMEGKALVDFVSFVGGKIAVILSEAKDPRIGDTFTSRQAARKVLLARSFAEPALRSAPLRMTEGLRMTALRRPQDDGRRHAP